MSLKSRQFRLALVVLASAFSLVGLVALLLQPTVSASGYQVRRYQENSGDWNYTTQLDEDGVLRSVVQYKYKTAADLKAFADTNRKLIGEIQGDIPVSVIFQRPLSLAEFRAFVQQKGLRVENYTLRAIDSKGLRVTIEGHPTPSPRTKKGQETVSQPIFDQVIAEAAKGGTFKGFITVDGVANQAEIRQLSSDNSVFMVEVTRGIALQRAGTRFGLAKSGGSNYTNTESRLVAPLYWALEDSGIAPK